MGRLVYRKRIELNTYDGMLRKVASAIHSHRDLRAYLVDVPVEQRESFLDLVGPLLDFELDRELCSLESDAETSELIDRKLADASITHAMRIANAR